MSVIATTAIFIQTAASSLDAASAVPVTHPATEPPVSALPTSWEDRVSIPPGIEEEDGDDEEDDIIVSGRRPRGSVATATPAEAQFSARTIRALGASSMDEVLDAFAPQSRSVSGNDAPVILLNGRRIGSISEIDALPPEAIHRIDIFPEQVALQYGYLANQRVVNVVLRRRYRSVEVQGRYNLASAKGRTAFRAKGNILRLTPNGRWNVDMLYRRQEPVYEDPDAGSSDRKVRTQAPKTDRFSTNGTFSRDFSAFTITGNADAELEREVSRLGRDSNQNIILRSVNRRNWHGGISLNGKEASWIWSLAGNYDDVYEETHTKDGRGADVGAPLLSARSRRIERAIDLASSGPLLSLPAGKATGAVSVAFASRQQHVRRLSSMGLATAISQDAGHFNASLDIPVISGKSGPTSPGDVSLLLNGQAESVSHLGDLTTYGYGFRWEPEPGATFTLFSSHTETAPDFSLRSDVGLLTPNVRFYDFHSGATTMAARLDGGNSALAPETSHLLTVRTQLRPFADENLRLSVDYSDLRKRNAVTESLGPTPQIEAAFPERFERNGNGILSSFDRRPLNLARTEQRQLRWGINFSRAAGTQKAIEKVLQSQTSVDNLPQADDEASPTPRSKSSSDQVQFAFYHTWHLEDRAILRAGLPSVDLLDGASLGNRGGQPRHEAAFQAGYASKMMGLRLAANWQSRTTVRDMMISGASTPHTLTYSQGIKLDIRLYFNLRLLGQPLDISWLNGRLNLSIDNVLNSRTQVRNENGQRIVYDRGASDVSGRSLRLTFRKIFH